MRVPVMMDVPSSHRLRGCNAALQGLATDVLELDGGVIDFELAVENIFKASQNAYAFRRRNICDRHMAGQGARRRSQAPNVEVVNIDHAPRPLA